MIASMSGKCSRKAWAAGMRSKMDLLMREQDW